MKLTIEGSPEELAKYQIELEKGKRLIIDMSGAKNITPKNFFDSFLKPCNETIRPV